MVNTIETMIDNIIAFLFSNLLSFIKKEGFVLVVNSGEISYYYPKEKCLLKLEDNDE